MSGFQRFCPYSEKISSDIGRMSVLAKRHQSNHPMGR